MARYCFERERTRDWTRREVRYAIYDRRQGFVEPISYVYELDDAETMINALNTSIAPIAEPRIVEIIEPGHMFDEDETAGYIQVFGEVDVKKLEAEWFGLGGANYGLTFFEFLLEQDGIVKHDFNPEVHVIAYQ